VTGNAVPGTRRTYDEHTGHCVAGGRQRAIGLTIDSLACSGGLWPLCCCSAGVSRPDFTATLASADFRDAGGDSTGVFAFRACADTMCFLSGLTFELRGRRRWDARPGLVKMYRVPPDRAWWPAVGAPFERGVRAHSRHCARYFPHVFSFKFQS
jgi:hypothetical protein